jgi:hypothetical protein
MCVFTAEADGHGDRWSYATQVRLSLVSANFLNGETVFVLDDCSALLDPARDKDQTGLTKTEHRRLSRFARAFAEKHDLKRVSIFLHNDWTEEYWRAVLPKVQRKNVSFDDLKAAIPQRAPAPKEAKTQAPAIRGLALVQAAGDQKPVFSVDEPDKTIVAWITAELYRSNGADCFKLAERYGIKKLYVASTSARGTIENAGVKSLRDLLVERIGARGVPFGDWFAMRNVGSGDLLKFGASLFRVDRAAYDKLARAKGEVSTVMKQLTKWYESGLSIPDEFERRTIERLFIEDGVRFPYLQPSNAFTDFENNVQNLTTNYYNPTVRFLGSVSNAKDDPANLAATVEAIIALQRVLPPSMPFNR